MRTLKSLLFIIFSTILLLSTACEKDEVSPAVADNTSVEETSKDENKTETEIESNATDENKEEETEETKDTTETKSNETQQQSSEENVVASNETKVEKESTTTTSKSTSSSSTSQTTTTEKNEPNKASASTSTKPATETKSVTEDKPPTSNNNTNTTKKDTSTSTSTTTKEQAKTPPPKKEEPKQTVTVSVIGDSEKGTVLSATKVEMTEGNTVLDVTRSILKQKGIPISVTGSGSSAYVQGIANLFEFDRGPLSGWTVKRNGATLERSAGIIQVNNGDTVQWIYTTNYKED